MISGELSQKIRYDVLANSFIPRLMPGIIHEINNPLGVILNNNEALKDYVKELIGFIDNDVKEQEQFDLIKKDLPQIVEEIERSKQKIVSILKGLQILTAHEEQNSTQDLNKLINNVLADRKSTRLNSSHIPLSRMPSSA